MTPRERLQNSLEDAILELVQDSESMTQSDIQGRATWIIKTAIEEGAK